MARGKVTESYSDMFIVGERDISVIAKTIEKFGFNDGDMNIEIVSHANLAVEKFLKGSGLKYDPNLSINGSVASDSVKLLENIYNFEEIKNIRDELRSTNKKYPQEENLLTKILNT